MNKELISIYYQIGLYSENDLNIFVKSGDITEEEKQTIVESHLTK